MEMQQMLADWINMLTVMYQAVLLLILVKGNLEVRTLMLVAVLHVQILHSIERFKRKGKDDFGSLCDDEPKGLKANMFMSLFYLPFAIANALTALLSDGVPLVDEFWVFLGYVVYTVFLYLHFATSFIHER